MPRLRARATRTSPARPSAPRPSGGRWSRSPSVRRARRRCSCRAASTPARSTARTPAFWSCASSSTASSTGVALDKIRVVFVPVFNVDGHERFGAHNRPNQVGPEEMGWRTTAQNLNLNRDYIKAEAPEMRAMLKLLQREDPIVYMDLHVTDGAEFQHDVAVLVKPADGDDRRAAGAVGRGDGAARAASSSSSRRRSTCRVVDFYPRLREARGSRRRLRRDRPRRRASPTPTRPRATASASSSRRTRGRTTRRACAPPTTRVVAVLRELTRARRRVAGAPARAADAEPLAGKSLVLDWEHRPDQAARRSTSSATTTRARPSPISTVTRIVYDTSKPEVWHIPFYDALVPDGDGDAAARRLVRAARLRRRGRAQAGRARPRRAAISTARARSPSTPSAPTTSSGARETFEGRATVQVQRQVVARDAQLHRRRALRAGRAAARAAGGAPARARRRPIR